MILPRNMNNNALCIVFTEKFKVEGKIQITQPMLNYRALTADDLIDKESADYKFLMDICTSIVSIKWCYHVSNSLFLQYNLMHCQQVNYLRAFRVLKWEIRSNSLQLSYSCSEKFIKNHKETSAIEPFFDKVAGLS